MRPEQNLQLSEQAKPGKRDAAANEMALRIINILSNGAKKKPVAEPKERIAA